jgi:hypothetical protein
MPERDSDEEVLRENEFPYVGVRFKQTNNWKKIVQRGEPWTDTEFKYGPFCLFKNRKTPGKDPFKNKEKWLKFTWNRASEHFHPK